MSKNFLDYIRENSSLDLSADVDKNLTLGDVHVPAAGGDDEKKKNKTKETLARVLAGGGDARPMAAKSESSVEQATFDAMGSADQSFDYWVEKLKLKQKATLECDPNELKALLASNPQLAAALAQILSQQPVGKAATRKLLVMRHGATHLNDDDTSVDRIRGWKDVPLSEEGKDEAAKLAEKVAKDPPDSLFSSDLKRAADTAKMVAAACDLKFGKAQQIEGLRPWDVGKFAGQKSKEAVPVLCDYAINKPDQTIPEGESFNDFYNRFTSCLAGLMKDNSDGIVGIVTHHRNERVLTASAKAGWKPGEIDGKEFTKKGEGTAGFELIDVPQSWLDGVASGKVAKFSNTEGLDLTKIWQGSEKAYDPEEPRDDRGRWASIAGGTGNVHQYTDRDGRNWYTTQTADGKVRADSAGRSPVYASSFTELKRTLGIKGTGKYMGTKEASIDKSFELNICKVDADQQIFYGWAYVSEENGQIVIDKQDDYIIPADLLKAAEEFTLHGGKLGDMHDARNVGRVVASFCTTEELCKAFGLSVADNRRGWILGFKVDDPEVWQKIKSGGQLELSIGGRGERIEG